MKPSPCLHPKFITCRDGVKRSVPCGQCAACLINKGRARSERLEQYLSSFPFRFFVTLTFNDEHLPLAYLDRDSNLLVHECDCDYDGVCYTYDLGNLVKQEDFDFVQDSVNKYGGVPVLSHRHLINFKKRLRYHFKQLKIDTNDLFIYGCGEYGPSTFRPHYHLIFGFRKNVQTDIFKECCNKAWSVCNKTKEGNFYESFGFTYVERISHAGCEDYTAKYLSCTTHLPKVLAKSRFKPFACGSNRASELLQRICQSEISEVFFNPVIECLVYRHGKQESVPVPSVYVSRYFPLVPRFGNLAHHERCALYGLFNKFQTKPYERFLAYLDNVIEYDTVIEYRSAFLDGRNYSFLPETMLQKLIDYVCFTDCNGNKITDSFIRKRNFMRVWYISRRVCLNALQLNVSIEEYVSRIESYYKLIELDKLKRFYKMQEELCDDVFHSLSLGCMFNLYYNTDSSLVDVDYYSKQFNYNNERLSDIPLQRAYASLSEGILKDTTKTKKRNDSFISHGKVKLPYIPRLSRSIKKFMSF